MKALVEAQLYRDAGAVKRFHVKRMHRTQTVAEHTFGMLMLVKQVAPKNVLRVVYDAILHHDLPELFTGDIPAPIKRAHAELGPLLDSIEVGLYPLYREFHLTPDEELLIKWADRMDLVLWCLEEVRMGNTFCAVTVARGLGWILAARLPEGTKDLTDQAVAEAATLGIVPATGAELEQNA